MRRALLAAPAAAQNRHVNMINFVEPLSPEWARRFGLE